MGVKAQQVLFHIAKPFDRLSYLVLSASRPEVEHLVDLEGFENESVTCTCESFILGGHRPCGHIKSVMIYR